MRIIVNHLHCLDDENNLLPIFMKMEQLKNYDVNFSTLSTLSVYIIVLLSWDLLSLLCTFRDYYYYCYIARCRVTNKLYPVNTNMYNTSKKEKLFHLSLYECSNITVINNSFL